MGLVEIEHAIKKFGNNCTVFKEDGTLTKQAEKTYNNMKDVMHFFGNETGLLSKKYMTTLFSKIDDTLAMNTPYYGLDKEFKRRLNNDDKENIYKLYRYKNASQGKLARYYNVSQQRISKIIEEMKEKHRND